MFLISFGSTGSIIASNIFVQTQGPRYPVGYGVSSVMLVFGGVLCAVFAEGILGMTISGFDLLCKNYRVSLSISMVLNPTSLANYCTCYLYQRPKSSSSALQSVSTDFL